MGALARPGPQFGPKGPPPPGSVQVEKGSGFAPWFWEFLREELAPYPGRHKIVLRMVLAATLTMWAIMTFRLPGAAIAAFYTLLLTRDSPTSTLKSATTVLVAYAIGAVWTVLGVMLFIDYPLTHFVWVVVSIFLCFFVIKVVTNYVGSAAFAFILTIAIPLWDSAAPTDLLLVATLWAAASVTVGLAATVAVEYGFSLFETRDDLVSGLVQRLNAVSLLAEELASGQVAEETKKSISQLAMVGVSRLRRLASNSSSIQADTARRSGMISLTGRLIDLAATVLQPGRPLSEQDNDRMHAVAERLEELSQAIQHGTPVEIPPNPDEEDSSGVKQGLPQLRELERTTGLLALSLSPVAQGETSSDEMTTDAQPTNLVRDAFTNPEHLSYALRGCLAASLCYVFINAAAYRALSTSLATCVITGLSSIGSSRQKQILRITGAAIGGLFFGIGAQVLVLPNLDTLAGFTVLFVVVTWIAAWIATSTPRLSYLGLQIALAFYLIHLQEYVPQTNLAIARDRVLGIALGLVAMWLVFDTLGSKPATVVMREIFATNLRLLAELAQPWKEDQPADLQKIRTMRDTVSMNFSSVNSQADAVLFEGGPSRQQDLVLRERLLRWQPQLRSVFLIQVGLLHYRTHVAPQELPPRIVEAQRGFDQATSGSLLRLAAEFGGGDQGGTHEESEVGAAYDRLRDAVDATYQTVTPRAEAVLALSSNLADVLQTLEREMRAGEEQGG